MKKISVISTFLCLGMVSCLPLSLNSIYKQEDIRFNKNLIGTWKGEDSKTLFQIKKHGNGYHITLSDREKNNGEFVGYLLNINNTLFLDIYPSGKKLKNCAIYQPLFIPAHTIARIDTIGDTLFSFSFLSSLWLQDYTQKDDITIQHQNIGYSILFTASTDEMQRFLSTIAHEKKAFKEPFVAIKKSK